ncbi:hypothetical protein PWT90_07950 [Aphanocladium album]|nr:hypothetical protein PWT90_07950 [Aphanocladium album]
MSNTTDTSLNRDFTADQLPQDPFLPLFELSGPVFLDTQACFCALRDVELGQDKDAVAWQCVGDQNKAYNTLDGKWFPTKNEKKDISEFFNDASNPPDITKPLFFNNSTRDLVDLKDVKSLGVYNGACTGKNNTLFSQSIYEANQQLNDGKYPISGAPCFQPGAIPLKIQYADSWQKNGCSEGFLCQNNTLNSLPVYCPPIKECLESRLAGGICKFNGKNIPMGYFEPIVCQEGWYCPPEKHGKETLRCPAGHYCQPGAATPTPCAVGSRCPEGSKKETYFVPLAIMIILDLLLLLGVMLLRFRSRMHTTSRAKGVAFLEKSKGMSALQATMGRYERLDDDNEHDASQHEMIPMSSTYMPGRDGWNGFQAVFDLYSATGEAVPKPANSTELNPQLKAFVDSMRRATDAQDFGLSFGYSGLSFHPKSSPRPILQNVTGSIEVGSLVAVMGGSGAGKSTFVNVLMGKTTHTGGMVTINGVPSKISRYKKLIGYVPQDDIVLPELTVFENILHSARIRLPRSWKDEDIKSHVECVIDCLELSHVRDSRVGSIGKPILSGGQRKRVSIGMELAAAPMAIFLDEPTSGLDATAASSIMKTLKALARLGISVITIIHQPRVEIFEILDNLILLANGQIIYEGSQVNVSKYFGNIGFQFPAHSNYADVITDIITGNGRDYKPSGDVSKDALITHWASHMAALPERQHGAHRASSIYNEKSIKEVLVQRGAPRWKQTWLCLTRAMTQQYRMKGAFIAEMALAGLAGLLLGLAMNSRNGVMFRGLYNSPFEQLSIATDFVSAPQLALLIAIAIGLVSGAPGVKTFSEELQLHKREAEAGHSRIAYFIAKNLSVFPRMFFGCLHFTTPLMLLATPIIPWGIAFLANVFYFYCIYGLASCISMVVRRADAPLLATMISLIVGILSGSAPPLSSAKKWHMEWLWRASPGTWLAELYFGQLVEPLRYLYSVDLAAKATGFHLNFLWRNMAILVGIGTIYRAVAYVGLVFGHRLRR